MNINCPKCKKPFEYHLEDGIIFRECDCESVSPPMNKVPIMKLLILCIGSGTVSYKEPEEWSEPNCSRELAKEYKRMITPESSDAEVEAAYQAMVQREGGDHSQGGECPNQPYDPTPHYPKFDPRPANKSHRFRPRLEKFHGFMAVQVHPEVIELFSDDLVYLCQVTFRLCWNGCKVICTRGGIPYRELRSMYMKTVCEKAHQENRSPTTQ